METQVIKVTPSIEMPPGAVEGVNKWFNDSLGMIYEKFVKPKEEAEKKEEKGA